jgi:hypothetical protein
MDHLDIGDVRSTVRRVTQAVAGSLFDDGAAGLFFRSRLDDQLCIALFEGRADLAPAGVPLPLTEPLPALLQVCSEFNLVLRAMDK